MNSLEFINNEIKIIETELQLDDVLVSYTDADLKWAKERLQTLQQIKIELEAWEVVKKKEVDINYFIEATSLKDYNCFCINIYNCEDYCLTQEEYNKIQKALEVKDNEKNE